jgi:hypothetical protein
MISGELISGGLAEWSNAPVLKTGRGAITPFIRPNRMPATKFAVPASALTPAGTFNHTQPKLYGPKQPELYLSGCVSQIGAQQWTNNKNENNAA